MPELLAELEPLDEDDPSLPLEELEPLLEEEALPPVELKPLAVASPEPPLLDDPDVPDEEPPSRPFSATVRSPPHARKARVQGTSKTVMVWERCISGGLL